MKLFKFEIDVRFTDEVLAAILGIALGCLLGCALLIIRAIK